eukprot:gene28502-35361_t
MGGRLETIHLLLNLITSLSFTDLGADYFQFDEARHELRGERT